jgi:hypothetical protein
MAVGSRWSRRDATSGYGTKRNCLGARDISGAEGRPAVPSNLATTAARDPKPSYCAEPATHTRQNPQFGSRPSIDRCLRRDFAELGAIGLCAIAGVSARAFCRIICGCCSEVCRRRGALAIGDLGAGCTAELGRRFGELSNRQRSIEMALFQRQHPCPSTGRHRRLPRLRQGSRREGSRRAAVLRRARCPRASAMANDRSGEGQAQWERKGCRR